MTNLKVFKSLEQEYPQVDFDAYFVKPSGSVAVVSESRRRKKLRQRKQNSLFSRNTGGVYGAWGPGPYGGYGYDAGYSGDGGGVESIQEKIGDVTQYAEPGDTIYSIARQNNLDPVELMKFNNFNKDTKLKRGQEVKIPQKNKTANADAPTSSKLKPIQGQGAQPASITGNPLETTLRDFAIKAGIKGKELAQFLAQCAHETANYSSLVEFGDPKEFLKRYDKQYNPEKAKILGNTNPGDGEKFKGRGFIQLTGRWNYTQAGQALGLPLDNKPELLEKPDVAAKASVWFWKNRVQPNVKNFTDTRTVTSYINPGLHGLQRRDGIFQNYLKTMQTPVKENVIQGMDFIDVYLRGRHKGDVITKSVVKNFPNQKLDQLIQFLVDKHGVNPNAIVYGPSKKTSSETEDYHPNDPPPGPETKPTMPKGTVRVDVSDVYDWYKLGQHISNLKGLGKHDFGKGPPSTIISFGSEEEEHKYIQDLMKLGLDTTDIDPVDPNQPKNMKRQKVDPTFNVDENFADGRNPQDKGDSARHGIPKKASISTLKSIRSSDTASPRKKQLAHWQINMRQGKKRSKE
jgi:putative chitinase